jgi:amino acid transporter
LGAGIYSLVGKVAGEAGLFAPVAFVVAAVLAVLTGFSYAELSARYPRSGGEAIYTVRAFGIRSLSTVIGLLVTFSAIVSIGVLTNAFVGYLQVFLPVSRELVITAAVLVAAVIAIFGIKESAFAASLFTIVEICGLLLIIWVGREGLFSLSVDINTFVPPADGVIWSGILAGALIAFYAFIGFEDMANIAEEVREPHRNLPAGILLAIFISTLLYCVIAIVSVTSLPIEELSASDAPLALIYERTTGSSPIIITFIGLFAIANGILVQIILGSRILFGLSRQAWLPAPFGRVHPVLHTPVVSTALVAVHGLSFALWLPLVSLAELTSYTVLIVYAFVNAACVRIKIREPHPKGVRAFPIAFPLFGFLVIIGFLGFRMWEVLKSMF